ncbi:MAG: hypothetical protein NZ988_05785 [Thaumarchaeota archaeon]|nr:hypothetical protein [Candidatus Calditenuaceae archaeon]MDW8187533.1 hypothetical protein [Nitrososphaerota archaeon]
MSLKQILRRDVFVVIFVALLTSTAYSVGGLLSLVLTLLVIGVLAAFVSMVKGVDVLIIYLVFSLFFVAIAQLASGVLGIVIILSIALFLAIRGLVNVPVNRNNLIKLGVIVAGPSVVYAVTPYPFGLIGFGAATALWLGLLAWSGAISLYVVYLLITKPRMGVSVLISRIRSSWEIGVQRVVEEGAVREAEVPRPVEERGYAEEAVRAQPTSVSGVPPEQPSQPAQIPVEVTRYLTLLRSLEENYKSGKINEAVYDKLKNEYVNRLMELGYRVEGSSR